ncbi:MAG: glycerophosphodiester phosphodiesterase family protein [Chloroflexota bacterium]
MSDPRTVRDSRIVMSQMMLPGDANPTGNVHGGVIMKLVDTAAGVCATRHVRGHTVTARIDSMSFLQPVFVGDLVTLKASVNDVGRTSMEVGVRVEAENLLTGIVRHVSSAHLVFVALDQHGHPRDVPPIVAESDEEKRRMAEAKLRRANRQRGDDAVRAMRASTSSRAFLTGWRRPAVSYVLVGHRGAAGSAPENTAASFQRALEIGVDAIEIDVHLTRDGVPVVIHDHTVDRTTDGKGRVADLTLAELKVLNAANGRSAIDEARIPTLDETLTWARGKTRLVIELKGTERPGLVKRTLDAVLSHQMQDDVMLISFDHFALLEARETSKDVRTGALYVGRPADPVALALACGADALCPHWSSVTPDDVAAIQRAGLAVCVWTTNEPSEIDAALRMGVDALTSDVPERIAAIPSRAR